MIKTSNAGMVAANLGIVRQAVSKAISLCKCGHRLDSQGFDDIVGDVTVLVLSPRGEKGVAPCDAFDAEKGSKFTSFLGMIAVRAAIDCLEKYTRRAMGSTDGNGNGDDGDDGDDGHTGEIPDTAPTAEAKMIDMECAVAVRAACKSLNCEEYLDPDYDHAKYAESRGISVNAARIRLCRTVDALAEEVKR
jgi:hypothetical protein